ncbi:MAG: NUDIX hydrolase [Acidobacteria bacterium]|nr:MAG: NUDIX hydrolase [Acidobacteriota bacterium]
MTPRPASTVLLLRDQPAMGIEVLMLRKNPRSEFASGAYVFPGGAVEECDAALATMPHLYSGLDDPAASEVLGIESGGLSYFAAAIREAFEEAGILIAYDAKGQVELPVGTEIALRLDAARTSLNAGEADFYSILESEESLQIAVEELIYMSHWITPVGPPRRYDTRFFAARAPENQVALHEGGETVDTIWISPSEAIEAASRNEIEIMFPTLRHLEMIRDFKAVDEALAWARARVVPEVLPRVVSDSGGIRVLIPGDEGYEEASG